MTSPQPPLILSYYTERSGYEWEAKRLIASCEQFRLPYLVEPLPSLGSWAKNCCYKPRFLLQKLEEFQRKVVWLDADAVIVNSPTLLLTLNSDIALYIVEEVEEEHPSKMISGTLLVNWTEKGREVLIEWDKECQSMLKRDGEEVVWDQIALKNVLLRLEGVEVFALPQEYYAIYDRVGEEGLAEPVIVHYQASRLLKKEVDREVIPFWTEEMVSHQKREAFIRQIKGGDRKKK